VHCCRVVAGAQCAACVLEGVQSGWFATVHLARQALRNLAHAGHVRLRLAPAPSSGAPATNLRLKQSQHTAPPPRHPSPGSRWPRLDTGAAHSASARAPVRARQVANTVRRPSPEQRPPHPRAPAASAGPSPAPSTHRPHHVARPGAPGWVQIPHRRPRNQLTGSAGAGAPERSCAAARMASPSRPCRHRGSRPP
jgi:hypothetical protein